MKFVEIPYLPQKKALYAVGDIKDNTSLVIPPYENKRVHPSLTKHTDLTFCYLGQGIAVCERESYNYYKEKLEKFNMTLIEGEKTLDMHYPSDAAYNVAIVGKKIFCKKSITDPVLMREAEKMGYKIVNINQGYGKCSVCPVSENAAISGDVSFARAAEREGVEVLLITNKGILLQGFDNGFFGGCAYMKDKNTIAFNGDITKHPDYEKIKNFLKSKEIEIENTSKATLYDFGSFSPIIEE
ncbi:MAG: DUF6873 family GME fold protein [Clostridia bacterium]